MTTPIPEGDEGLDLSDLQLFESGIPHRVFERLRSHAPVHRSPGRDGGFWSLVRHEDVCAVNRDSLGAGLARLELRVMLEELLRRVRALRVAGRVVHAGSNFSNGILSLPVELEAA